VYEPAKVWESNFGNDIFIIALPEDAIDQMIVQQNSHPAEREQNKCKNALESAEQCTNITDELKQVVVEPWCLNTVPTQDEHARKDVILAGDQLTCVDFAFAVDENALTLPPIRIVDVVVKHERVPCELCDDTFAWVVPLLVVLLFGDLLRQ